eukprot:GHVN01072176.1.p1 GENE.GHVN01072176.1~~GHVN01072176.1.p1  ORF type:complete len:134 (+),score=9.80 GHVN01072176.1:1427-1828(+)
MLTATYRAFSQTAGAKSLHLSQEQRLTPQPNKGTVCCPEESVAASLLEHLKRLFLTDGKLSMIVGISCLSSDDIGRCPGPNSSILVYTIKNQNFEQSDKSTSCINKTTEGRVGEVENNFLGLRKMIANVLQCS